MAIVTISCEMGSGGVEIGRAVAERLGYRFVDTELITEAAHRYGLLEEKLSSLDETKPSILERFDTETRRYLTVSQAIVYEFAMEDRVVIIGRGGQFLLREVPHAIRVRVTAPFEMRVKRVMKKMPSQMGEALDVRSATELVRRNDAEKGGRVRYLYGVNWADPAFYDLVINTEKLAVNAAVELVATLANRPELRTTEAGRQLVANRTLAFQVQAALAAHPETRKSRISVEAENGVVTLEGTSALDDAEEVARAVPGVRDVRIRQMEIPPIPPFVG
ncbi:MAG TPA: cytidylate kinase family protein [Methylomirabilota bacterium]|nr:cytidylate kinase family protein [Methylomirabilota bacterium]